MSGSVTCEVDLAASLGRIQPTTGATQTGMEAIFSQQPYLTGEMWANLDVRIPTDPFSPAVGESSDMAFAQAIQDEEVGARALLLPSLISAPRQDIMASIDYDSSAFTSAVTSAATSGACTPYDSEAEDDEEYKQPRQHRSLTANFKRKLNMGEDKTEADPEDADSRRKLKLERNRISAQQSRLRKKQQVVVLEAQVSEITRAKNQLEVLVAQLLWENQRLRSGLNNHKQNAQ
eukprot:TRINITY_DN15320_c0_g1_i1.p1 TRINITY_DN15320_c0_g1~~TRINITY_DN15320_c0_g1_i1.p1  ORF type:complete len:233 (+),score=49.27 TRINITY_DN15320_c0_g1_i1:99-797(+)